MKHTSNCGHRINVRVPMFILVGCDVPEYGFQIIKTPDCSKSHPVVVNVKLNACGKSKLMQFKYSVLQFAASLKACIFDFIFVGSFLLLTHCNDD
jgi:hypothetical protein